MMSFLKQADHLLLATPVLACASVGAASGFMEQSSYAPVRALGWLGCRSAIILGVLSGIPLLIYSVTKVLFAKVLNAITWNYFTKLQSFEKHAEMQFAISVIGVSTLPMAMFALPTILRAGYKAYQTYQEIQRVIDDFYNSDFYKSLRSLYDQYQQWINPNELVAVDVVVDAKLDADGDVAVDAKLEVKVDAAVVDQKDPDKP